MKEKLGVRGVKHLLGVQLLFTAVLAVIFLLSYGNKEAASALLGGFTVIIPSALFARKLFRYQGARAARQIVKSFYIGEAIKLLSSIILFALVFTFFNVSPLVFFLTYIVVLMNHWFAPLIFANKQNRPESD